MKILVALMIAVLIFILGCAQQEAVTPGLQDLSIGEIAEVWPLRVKVTEVEELESYSWKRADGSNVIEYATLGNMLIGVRADFENVGNGNLYLVNTCFSVLNTEGQELDWRVCKSPSQECFAVMPKNTHCTSTIIFDIPTEDITCFRILYDFPLKKAPIATWLCDSIFL